MADWVTISSLATAGGTLVLAIATFGSVRSANRAARVAEQALLAGQRPLLISSHLDDPSQKVSFVDEKWLHVAGGGAAGEATDEAVYLAVSLRNVGNGIAVLHGWHLDPDRGRSAPSRPPPEGDFTRLSRDLYIAAGDTGFWQGSFRDPSQQQFAAARAAIAERRYMSVFILYGDQEGGQRVISMFGLNPRDDGAYIATIGRHWQLDRPDPR
ncbi:MAG TPA: hypothetical protein VFQ71_01610 [Gaiellales bacterium]|jgi:hypothetical protein|nr:hypothetical protein [Gaiellales bacterium]